MHHDNEEWCKIWRRIDLSFQNSLDDWWLFTRALQSLKNVHFNGLLLSKVYINWAKKVQRNNLSRNWRGIQNLERNRLAVSKLPHEILQILTRALVRLQNLHFSGPLSSKVYIVWAKKSIQELSFMKLKDRKFVEELTRHFKIGVRNFTKFDASTRKSQKF